jgi:hypothetical protein
MIVTDRTSLRAVRVGVEIAAILYRMYGSKFEIDDAERLFGSKDGLTRIRRGDDPADIASSWAAGEARWRLLWSRHLLYR